MSEMSLTMYVLVPTGIYDHGVIGVYSSEEIARDVAKEIWPKTDGYHGFRIDVVVLDETYDDVFNHTDFTQKTVVPDSEAPIVLNSKSPPDV